MNDAVRQMLARYELSTNDDHLRALREILQELALLGLWRSHFFEHAACYGGTALRVLHGLNRFSEDLDFSLLVPQDGFAMDRFTNALETELLAFGFEVTVETKGGRPGASAIRSAFLKADTLKQLIEIRAPETLTRAVPRGARIRIRLEIDTDPPPGFATETRYLLAPIPFPVRVYTLPDLFAGKMHALLCRRWKTRVKGRDWYDFVWYAGHHPELRLAHLQARMVQSGHWPAGAAFSAGDLQALIAEAIGRLNIDQARQEVAPFVPDSAALATWSAPLFDAAARRIVAV